MSHHIVGLALLDLCLQGLNLELSLLQLTDTLTGRTLVLVELTLLLFDKFLQKINKVQKFKQQQLHIYTHLQSLQVKMN